MIQGLKFRFTGKEVKSLLLQRSAESLAMAKEWQASLTDRIIILATDGETERLTKSHAQSCQFDGEAFKNAADHIVEDETYELTRDEFPFLGLQRTINDQKSADEYLKLKASAGRSKIVTPRN